MIHRLRCEEAIFQEANPGSSGQPEQPALEPSAGGPPEPLHSPPQLGCGSNDSTPDAGLVESSPSSSPSSLGQSSGTASSNVQGYPRPKTWSVSAFATRR